ncbi:hypothetical protein LTR53_015853 [Teratosphaeriaceae sp. CCFEE 6253]|nr:hypothetical protein LTR53_015853 [Teratosphaeriaceae sp. CCFEE 6253]
MAPPPTTPHGLPLASPTSSILSSWIFTGLHQLQNRLLHSEQANADAEVQVSTLIMERDAAISDARKLNQVRQAAAAEVTKWKGCAQTKAQELEAGKAEFEKVEGEKEALATASRTAQEAKVEAERALRERDAELDVCKAEVLLLQTGLEQVREERDGAREAVAAAETKLESRSVALALLRGCHRVTMQSLEEHRGEIAELKESCASKSASAFVLRSKLEDVEEVVAQLGAQKAELVQDRRQMAVALAVSEQCRLPLMKQHRAGVEALYQNISQTARLQAKSDLQRAAIDRLVRIKAETIGSLAQAGAGVEAVRVRLGEAQSSGAEAWEAAQAMTKRLAAVESMHEGSRCEIAELRARLAEEGNRRGSIAQRLERQSAEEWKLKALLKRCQEENAEIHGIQQKDAAALAAAARSLSEVRAERDASLGQVAALTVRVKRLASNGRKLHVALTKHSKSALLLSCLLAHQSQQSSATALAFSEFFLELAMSRNPTALMATPYLQAERCKSVSLQDGPKTPRIAGQRAARKSPANTQLRSLITPPSATTTQPARFVMPMKTMVPPASDQLPSPSTPPPAIMTQPFRLIVPAKAMVVPANAQLPSPTTPAPAIMTQPVRIASPTKAMESPANTQLSSPATPTSAIMTHRANSTSPTKATMQASPSSGRMPKPAVVIETVASAAVSPDPRQRARASVAAAPAPTASMSAGVQKRRSSSVFVPRPMKRVRVDSKA